MAMAMEINTVQNKDCMDGMAAMDGGSVDLVIADPTHTFLTTKQQQN